MSRFPDNATLIQFFGYFNTALFLVVDSRRRIQVTVDAIAPADVTAEELQEAGEELGTLLGGVLEVKINVNRLKTRLGNLL